MNMKSLRYRLAKINSRVEAAAVRSWNNFMWQFTDKELRALASGEASPELVKRFRPVEGLALPEEIRGIIAELEKRGGGEE